jgi:predicted nucleotidyltransferase component of viral defense system
MSIIEQMLSKYNIETENDLFNALKEIFQEITLLGLYRANFFSKAAFYGGTSLRILYGLNRFSEDLDFSLLEKNEKFNIENYFQHIIDEFAAYEIEVIINKKEKSQDSRAIESAFLKNNTSVHTLDFQTEALKRKLSGIHSGRAVKIKIEVDVNPPLKFETESKTILLPHTFSIVSMTLPNLYAGKMHAVLCRKWKTRVKGRDWYDFEWYVKRNTKLNLLHLQERMIESGDLNQNEELSYEIFLEFLHSKIDSLDFEKAKEEVRPFLKDYSG